MQLRRFSSKNRTRNTNYKKPSKKHKRHQTCRKSEKCVCTPMQPSSFEFPSLWRELRARKQLCDGIVHCVDGIDFHIHRAILSTVSPYFRALFTNSINRGAQETYEAHVSAPGEIFDLLLDFAYTGACAVNCSNVEELLRFADQYECLGVVQLSCKFLLGIWSNSYLKHRFSNQTSCRCFIRNELLGNFTFC